MTNFNWEQIASTSWVTFAIFIYLIIIGFKATKPSFISIRQLYFTTGLFFVLSITWLYIHLTFYNSIALIVSVIPGILLGWLHFWIAKVKAVKDQKQIRLPGSWFLLIMVLAIIFSMLYYNFDLFSFSENLTTSKKYAFPLLITYGFFTGLFIGRLMYAIKCVKQGPYVS